MRLESILYHFGFDKCILRAIQKVDKRIVSDANFNIQSYVKERIAYGIAKEIEKRKDIVKYENHGDPFCDEYRAEIFVFSREELEKLIDKLTETR